MPETTYRKKLIEVALPLEVINRESAREKSIRHGHPSTLHLWWARRPLAAARAVLFAQLVDDPSAWPERFPTEDGQEAERKRLFKIIEDMVPWEASNNEELIGRARREIAQSWARSHPSDKAKRVLADDAAADEINNYLATELPPVHDPFAGGGTIPLEAQRLGLRAIASDLNPVAVLINKALIEIPPRFAGLPPVNPESRAGTGAANKKGKRAKQASLAGTERRWKGAEGLAEDVRYYGRWMRDEAKKRIGHLYPDAEITAEMAQGRRDLEPLVGERLTIIAWIWTRTVASPDPAFAGVHVPIASTFWLATKENRETWVAPVLTENGRNYVFDIQSGTPPNRAAIGLGNRAGKAQDFVCLLSKATIPRDYIRTEGKAGRLGQRLMAIVAHGKRGRIYLPPTAAMEAIAVSAAQHPAVADARATFLAGATPTRAMITGGVCSAYGLATWGDLYTPRQMLALITMSDLVMESRAVVVLDAQGAGVAGDERSLASGGSGAISYGDAIATYLACALSRSADFWCSLATWSAAPKNELVSHAFTKQALPMTWDFGEINPFSDSGGNFQGQVEFAAKACERLMPPPAPGIARQASATTAPPSLDAAIVSTDPPYFDNISYAELSDFFYVWLRRTLRETFPEETRTLLVPKQEELIASPFRHGSKDAAEAFFLKGMTSSFAALALESLASLPTTIYYAFKQAETDAEGTSSTGWETFLEAVLAAGFSIHGTWPVRTERAGRSVGIGTNALASSIVLACARRSQDAGTATRPDLRRLLRQELPKAVAALQHGNIAPVDVAQASIGPGMAIFSRYSKVLEADGSTMTVRSALQLINEVLDEHLTEHEGELDADSRFAVTWYENRAFDSGPYGEAETLAKARAVAVEGIAESGILKSGGGKVRLLKRSELPDDWDPTKDSRLTTWEATQHLIKRLEAEGEGAAAALLAKLGPLAGAARDLAYRLYSTCERKGWAEEARSYNGLVVAWPDLERLAGQADNATTAAQQSLL